jgi:hypothetical protein
MCHGYEIGISIWERNNLAVGNHIAQLGEPSGRDGLSSARFALVIRVALRHGDCAFDQVRIYQPSNERAATEI